MLLFASLHICIYHLCILSATRKPVCKDDRNAVTPVYKDHPWDLIIQLKLYRKTTFMGLVGNNSFYRQMVFYRFFFWLKQNAKASFKLVYMSSYLCSLTVDTILIDQILLIIWTQFSLNTEKIVRRLLYIYIFIQTFAHFVSHMIVYLFLLCLCMVIFVYINLLLGLWLARIFKKDVEK